MTPFHRQAMYPTIIYTHPVDSNLLIKLGVIPKKHIGTNIIHTRAMSPPRSTAGYGSHFEVHCAADGGQYSSYLD